MPPAAGLGLGRCRWAPPWWCGYMHVWLSCAPFFVCVCALGRCTSARPTLAHACTRQWVLRHVGRCRHLGQAIPPGLYRVQPSHRLAKAKGDDKDVRDVYVCRSFGPCRDHRSLAHDAIHLLRAPHDARRMLLSSWPSNISTKPRRAPFQLGPERPQPAARFTVGHSRQEAQLGRGESL